MNSPTPEFLLWSLDQNCLLRDEISENIGHPVLRHLRPLRAWSESCEQGRIFEGICVQVSSEEIEDATQKYKGFRSDEMFEFYGGEEYCKAQCKCCPANTSETFFDAAVGGCAGMVQVDVAGTSLHALVSTGIERLNLDSLTKRIFLPTVTAWYGLWARSPLVGQQLEVLETVFNEVITSLETDLSGSLQIRPLLEFHEAIRRAHAHDMPLNVEVFPTGLTTPDKYWVVHAHCYDCKAPMNDSDRKCIECGRVGGPHPKLRRRARGDRPYWSLSGFLGEQGAVEFISRYRNSGTSR